MILQCVLPRVLRIAYILRNIRQILWALKCVFRFRCTEKSFKKKEFLFTLRIPYSVFRIPYSIRIPYPRVFCAYRNSYVHIIHLHILCDSIRSCSNTVASYGHYLPQLASSQTAS